MKIKIENTLNFSLLNQCQKYKGLLLKEFSFSFRFFMKGTETIRATQLLNSAYYEKVFFSFL